MQPSILKSALLVALGITSAAAQSFSATKWYKCCTQEDCTDCTTASIGDSNTRGCPRCMTTPGSPGKLQENPEGLQYKYCCDDW